MNDMFKLALGQDRFKPYKGSVSNQAKRLTCRATTRCFKPYKGSVSNCCHFLFFYDFVRFKPYKGSVSNYLLKKFIHKVESFKPYKGSVSNIS